MRSTSARMMLAFPMMLSLILGACSLRGTVEPENEWAEWDANAIDEDVRSRIAGLESGALTAMESRLRVVLHNGQLAYLEQAPCCDQFNHVYAPSGKRLCAASGGFAGHGDGRCGLITPLRGSVGDCAGAGRRLEVAERTSSADGVLQYRFTEVPDRRCTGQATGIHP